MYMQDVKLGSTVQIVIGRGKLKSHFLSMYETLAGSGSSSARLRSRALHCSLTDSIHGVHDIRT